MPLPQGVWQKQPQEARGTRLGPYQQEGNGRSKRREFVVFSGDAMSSRPGRDMGSGGSERCPKETTGDLKTEG